MLSQVEVIKETRGKLEAGVEAIMTKANELTSDVEEKHVENSRLTKEVEELQRRKVKLSSEVNGKEESLARLNSIGFLDEDLLRLRTILERIAAGKTKEIGNISGIADPSLIENLINNHTSQMRNEK